MADRLADLLSQHERQAVYSLLDQLRERYPERFLQATLFGSKARGDSRSWSDIDVLIIVDDDDWRFQHAISTLAARVSLEFDVVIGPRVISRERWERLKADRFSLYRNVAAEGIPLTPDLA
jgi:predicted nucleotidyltransferase